MIDRDHPSKGLSKEDYNMLADAILYELNPQAYLFFVLEEMSRGA